MPLSATLSISSRISLKFKCAYLSDQLVAKQMLGLGELESRPAVVAVRLQDEKDVVLGRDLGEKRDVLLGDERELQHLAGVELGVGVTDRLDEAAELRAEDVERNVAGR